VSVCVSHQLMDGRKAVGGKLEVKIRVRDPYVTKQVDEVKEKWLVIDHFERNLPPAATATAEVIHLLLVYLCALSRFL